MNENDKLNILATDLATKLKQKGLNLKIAESFTGGLVSASLVGIEGASTFLSEALICYSGDSKIIRLGVCAATIKEFTAVSCACLRQMLGGLIKAGADIAIATSGNAGPTSSGGKVGVCFVGVIYNDKTYIQKAAIEGNRKDIILKGTILALNAAINLLS